jgi:hypothetical protein
LRRKCMRSGAIHTLDQGNRIKIDGMFTQRQFLELVAIFATTTSLGIQSR